MPSNFGSRPLPTRGLVVRVKNEDGGEFVTVQWLVRSGMEGKTSVHRARDLRKLSAQTNRGQAAEGDQMRSSIRLG